MDSLIKQVRPIFNKVQHAANISKMCDTLLDIEKEHGEEEFWEVFKDHLTKAMVLYRGEPAGDKIMSFCATYATYRKRDKPEAPNDSMQSDCSEEVMDPFLLKLFEFLLKYHNAREKAVRFRCCQLINKILNNLGDEDTIDEGLSDSIYHCMIVRIKDKFPAIRIQAILALMRLQDPEDEQCPTIDAFLRSLETDTHADVRKTILSNIALSRKTLPYVLGRIRDIKDANRKTAYMTLSEKVSIRALTIAQRIHILTIGLKDRTEMVQNACGHLLKTWLRSYDHNVIKLLEALDTEGTVECSKSVLEYLFKDAPMSKMESHVTVIKELAKKDDSTSNEIRLIDYDKLTPEIVCYWYMICKQLKSLGDEGEIMLQTLVPELTTFCTYVRGFMEKYFIDSALLSAFETIDGQPEFILEHLLNIICFLDFADEVGRKNLQDLIHDLLVCETTPLSLVKTLVSTYIAVEKKEDKFIQDLVETISDIRQPLVKVVSTATKEKNRRNELQVARISVQINECKEDLEAAIKKQNFQQAALLQEQVVELQSEKDQLLKEINEDEGVHEERVERDDPETMLKCLTVASAMLDHINKKGLKPSLMTLKEELIFEGVTNEDPFIRNQAVQCLGMLSLLSKDFAMQHLVLLLQIAQVDQELVQITAVKAILDLFMMYGLFEFDQYPSDNKEKDEDKDDKEADAEKMDEDEDKTLIEDEDGENKTVISETPPSEASNPSEKNAAEKVLEILLMFLESESPDLRTTVAEGLAKLSVTGRALSAKILSKLILLWYNPITEDDNRLRHCIGVFLPEFSFQRIENQELLGQCFLPIIRTLNNAPTTSPLSQVNVSNVIGLLTQLTDVDNLYANQKAMAENSGKNKTVYESHIHDSIAVRMCNEIFAEIEDIELVRMYLKALSGLNLCKNNITVIQDLREMAMNLVEELATSKLAKKMAERFWMHLENIGNSNVSSNSSSQSSTQQNTTNPTSGTPRINISKNHESDTEKTLPINDGGKTPANKSIINSTMINSCKSSAKPRGAKILPKPNINVSAIALQQQLEDSISRDVKHKLTLTASTKKLRSSKRIRLSKSVDFAMEPLEDLDEISSISGNESERSENM